MCSSDLIGIILEHVGDLQLREDILESFFGLIVHIAMDVLTQASVSAIWKRLNSYRIINDSTARKLCRRMTGLKSKSVSARISMQSVSERPQLQCSSSTSHEVLSIPMFHMERWRNLLPSGTIIDQANCILFLELCLGQIIDIVTSNTSLVLAIAMDVSIVEQYLEAGWQTLSARRLLLAAEWMQRWLRNWDQVRYMLFCDFLKHSMLMAEPAKVAETSGQATDEIGGDDTTSEVHTVEMQVAGRPRRCRNYRNGLRTNGAKSRSRMSPRQIGRAHV